MPLVYQQNINGSAKLGVWHITEPEDFFTAAIAPLKSISHPHKRLQHLAGLYLLTSLHHDFPTQKILLNDSGKPVLLNGQLHFSISHCDSYAAAIISGNDIVGTDIEKPGKRILALKNKFTSDDELSLFSAVSEDDAEKLTMIWSVKEAMFKWAGTGLIDFRKHLVIESVMESNGQILIDGNFRKEKNIHLKATLIRFRELILAAVI